MSAVWVCGRMMAAAAAADSVVLPDPSVQKSRSNDEDFQASQVALNNSLTSVAVIPIMTRG